MTVKRIIFIRPGETDWNRMDRWQGWVASPLNTHGKRQAEALANFLRNIGLGALYSSDLKRAAETAAIIAQKLDYQPIYDERLRERNVGNWQGMTLEEVHQWYPEAYEAFAADPYGYQVPGGESLKDVQARMKSAFDEIVGQAKAETIGVVSHTLSIRTLLDDVLKDRDFRNLRLGNTAVTTIRNDGSGWTALASNDITHLEVLDSRAVREL
jgi:2,3-bisphosphoglycerate-dependent phosphoglycerate mutase